MSTRKLKAGEWVEVLGATEILRTLDHDGRLDGLPFMPEMLAYCGRRFRIGAVAHKTCDTATRTGGRRLDRTVHLEELRCDGSAHGGCQAECRLFWKDAWLRKVGDGTSRARGSASGCTEDELRLSVQTGPDTYACQATLLPRFTEPLAWWDLTQYARDVVTRNHRPIHALRVLALAATRKLVRLPIGYRAFDRIYRAMHRLLTRRESPYVVGRVDTGRPTPDARLDLSSGEFVRVRPLASIAATLDGHNKNRGLAFDPEMASASGRTFRVRRRVERIIDEKTGRMLELKNPCITLEGVACRAEYSECRLLCPRAIPSYWREAWLERVVTE